MHVYDDELLNNWFPSSHAIGRSGIELCAVDMGLVKAALPFLSHYAQKYVMERHLQKTVQDDGGYEDQLFAALDEVCDACGEARLDRAELVEMAKDSNALMWGA